MMSDSDLHQALLGTWRLVIGQTTGGKPFGDNPQGYLVYTPDGHVFVQIASRDRPQLFGPSANGGPVLLQTTEANTALGLTGYCGTFEIRDGHAIHHMEFGVLPRHNGHVESRSVVLDGDRLTLGTPRGASVEWQRVH
jgi:hypothetical protein